MHTDHDTVIIGRLSSAYGIKGWLHLTSFATPPENIFSYKNWSIRTNTGLHNISIESYKQHNKNFVVKITDCNDRTAAEKLTGLNIEIPKSSLPQAEEGTYYWSDLIGLKVTSTTGTDLGVVDHLFDTGANDVIVTKKEKKQQLIPYINTVIITVDLDKKTILVDWEPI